MTQSETTEVRRKRPMWVGVVTLVIGLIVLLAGIVYVGAGRGAKSKIVKPATQGPSVSAGALMYQKNSPMAEFKADTIAMDLTNSDRAVRETAVAQIRASMESGPDGVAAQFADQWIDPLMSDKRYEEVANWTLLTTCSVPKKLLALPQMEKLLETRVTALLALKKNDEALSAAKRFYNFIRMSETPLAANFVAQCLKADPKSASLAQKFWGEQGASSGEVKLHLPSVLSTVTVDPEPYASMAQKISGWTGRQRGMEKYHSMLQIGNRLLLADRPVEAEKVFTEAYVAVGKKSDAGPDWARPYLAESIARCIRAKDGMPGRAKAWLEEVTKDQFPDELPVVEGEGK